jgi:hypothetical protein
MFLSSAHEIPCALDKDMRALGDSVRAAQTLGR